jgi:hypothetical protein
VFLSNGLRPDLYSSNFHFFNFAYIDTHKRVQQAAELTHRRDAINLAQNFFINAITNTADYKPLNSGAAVRT